MQYLSSRYTERLVEAGIERSVGSKGDSYDNALAETINGLYKAEVIHRRGPWRTAEAVEIATLEWVSWFNHDRPLEPIGYIPLPSLRQFTTATKKPKNRVRLKPLDSNKSASSKAGAIHNDNVDCFSPMRLVSLMKHLADLRELVPALQAVCKSALPKRPYDCENGNTRATLKVTMFIH